MTMPVPVESANYLSNVQLFHSPIRKEHTITAFKAQALATETALKMAVEPLKISNGPDGANPSLLAYLSILSVPF